MLQIGDVIVLTRGVYLYLYFLGWFLWAMLVLIVAIKDAKTFYDIRLGAETAAASWIVFGLLFGSFWFACVPPYFLYLIVKSLIQKGLEN